MKKFVICKNQNYLNRGRNERGLLMVLKFIYSEKATKLCEIFPLPLTTVHTVKSKGKISQNSLAFSEYMNFMKNIAVH